MRSRPAIFLLLLFLSGCYNSPSQEQSNNSTQPTAVTSTETHADGNENDKKAMEENLPDGKSEEAMLADVLEQIQDGKALLVDVRRDEEWEEAHFESARHIPLDTINENAETAFAEIDKQQTVFIHWRAGGRAGRAAKTLKEQGYNVVPLEVKYEALKAAGFKEAAK